jgi:hypothetical protein
MLERFGLLSPLAETLVLRPRSRLSSHRPRTSFALARLQSASSTLISSYNDHISSPYSLFPSFPCHLPCPVCLDYVPRPPCRPPPFLEPHSHQFMIRVVRFHQQSLNALAGMAAQGAGTASTVTSGPNPASPCSHPTSLLIV